MKKPLAVLLVIAVVAAVCFWWIGRNNSYASELILHGNVDIRQISLAFEGTGRITELKVEEGDRVTAGQIIGLLDTKTLELQAEQAQAQAEVQRQMLLKLQNGSRPEEVSQARSQLKSQEAEVSRTAKDLDRLIKLQKIAEGAISIQNLDYAKADAESAKAKADELRETVRLAEIGPRAEEIAGAEAQLKASEAQIALLRHQIEQGKLVAPSDAVVRSRLMEPGDMVTSQKAVYALALTHPKWIRVYVNEPDLGKVKPGMEARVTTDSHPDQPVIGKVGYISSVAEFTPKAVQTEELRTKLVYEVRVIVEDNDNVLRLGQPATVSFEAKAAE